MVWWDGGLVDASQAILPVMARGVQFGYGIFETFRTYGGGPFRLGVHLARFAASAALVHLDVPPTEDVERAVAATLDANRLGDAAVRITALASASAGAPVASRSSGARENAERGARGEPTALHIAAHPVPDWTRARAAGATAIVSRIRRDALSPLAGVKQTSALPSIVARHEAYDAGTDEAILLTTDGLLCETSAANVFLVREGVLLTPSPSCGCLAGVTRAVVLELAPRLGLSVSEGEFDRVVLDSADECFMTGSVREVVPIVAIDGADVARGLPGAVTRDVQAAYEELVREEVAAARTAR